MEKNFRKVYEHPLAEEVKIIPENMLCASDAGASNEGFDVSKEDL